MSDGESNARGLREWLLPVLFVLALSWAFFWLGFWLVGEQFEVLNPFSESSRLHHEFEQYTLPFVIIVLAGAVSLFVTRLWPGFLRVPPQVTSSQVALSLLTALPIVALVLLTVLSTVGWIVDSPGSISDDPQHIPGPFWVGPLGTIVLAPILTVFAAWWAVHRKDRGRNG